MDFSGGPVVGFLPGIAGDTGLIPGWGTKIPHAAEQLSLSATTKILCAVTTTQCSQVNKYFFKMGLLRMH